MLSVEEGPAEDEPKFNPFTGVGRRLDGKPSKNPLMPASTSVSVGKQSAVTNGKGTPSAASTSQSARQTQGKLVFGSNANRTPKEKLKVLLLTIYTYALVLTEGKRERP